MPIAAEARFSLDVRGPQDALFQGVARDTRPSPSEQRSGAA